VEKMGIKFGNLSETERIIKKEDVVFLCIVKNTDYAAQMGSQVVIVIVVLSVIKCLLFQTEMDVKRNVAEIL